MLNNSSIPSTGTYFPIKTLFFFFNVDLCRVRDDDDHNLENKSLDAGFDVNCSFTMLIAKFPVDDVDIFIVPIYKLDKLDE
jgi:hypothetical protein